MKKDYWVERENLKERWLKELAVFLDEKNEQLRDLIREHKEAFEEKLEELNEARVEELEEMEDVDEEAKMDSKMMLRDAGQEALDEVFYRTSENDWAQTLQYETDWDRF